MLNEWTIAADVDQAAPAVEALEAACAELLGPDKLYRLCLAADELLTNAATHGHGEAPIRLTLEADETELVVEISDGGPAFDPLSQAPPPVLEAPLEDRRPGGLGIYLVKTLVDQVAYRREADRNVMRLVMRR